MIASVHLGENAQLTFTPFLVISAPDCDEIRKIGNLLAAQHSWCHLFCLSFESVFQQSQTGTG